jgi:hypothetical protein
VKAQAYLLVAGQNYLTCFDEHTAEAHIPRTPAHQPQSGIADDYMQSQRFTLI